MQVTDYRLSGHWGICWGPVDALLAIYIGEKEWWSGSVSDLQRIDSDKPDLFGGREKEGGASGSAYYLPGYDDQILPDVLARRLDGLTGATAPGYRGLSSVFFTGVEGEFLFDHSLTGFMWGSNNPYIKPIWMTVRRAPKGLESQYAMIGNQVSGTVSGYYVECGGASATLTNGVSAFVGGHTFTLDYLGGDPNNGTRNITIDGVLIAIVLDDDLFTVTIGEEVREEVHPNSVVNIYGISIEVRQSVTTISFGASGVDANGAHMIYECLTNTDWGMGSPPSSINVESFSIAGRTLFNEGLGLSMAWMASTTIDAFVGEILDHILATLFVNPADGLLTLKLWRNDYNRAELFELTPDNCEVTAFDRKGWGETTNEIVVTWTNPTNESEESITLQDLGNIAIQGAIVSDARGYHGVRNSVLAMQLAERDLRSASAPLASFELEVDRSAWNFVPGSVVKLTYPEEGVYGVILRIGKINYGKAGSPTIRVNAVEDIFGLPVAAYGSDEPPAWVDPSRDPEPVEFATILTVPRYLAEQNLSAPLLSSAEFPEVVSMVFAAQKNADTADYVLMTQELQPDGSYEQTTLGIRSFASRATLASILPQEAVSVVSAVTGGRGKVPASVNIFVMIGATESTAEIALITAVGGGGAITLARGLLDTTPRAWPVGTPIWFFPRSFEMYDATTRLSGEAVSYKLLSNTSKGTLSPDDAPDVAVTLSSRPWLPNRPANVQINGQAFGSLDVGDDSSVAVTWANRNRLMEPVSVLRWASGSVTPESGQTTRITVMKLDRTVLTVHSGLTGTSFTLPASSFLGQASGIVQVRAERDGLLSLQAHEITVALTPRGYGFNYGNFYGG